MSFETNTLRLRKNQTTNGHESKTTSCFREQESETIGGNLDSMAYSVSTMGRSKTDRLHYP